MIKKLTLEEQDGFLLERKPGVRVSEERHYQN